MTSQDTGSPANSDPKSCFIISPIGEPNSPEREHNDSVRDFVVKEAVRELGYEAVRADEIAEPGSITSQIMQRIFDDDLIVADLTDHNPNVFYELSVRHAVGKPFVQIITEGQDIPFDVQGMRLIFYDLTKPASVHKAKTDIIGQVKAWESDPNLNVQTPITRPLEFLRISQSTDADVSGFMEILPLIQDMSSSIDETRVELQRLSRSTPPGGARMPPAQLERLMPELLHTGNPYAFVVAVSALPARMSWLSELGMESFRQVMGGNVRAGREIFRHLMGLMEASPVALSSRRHPEFESVLGELFNRFVEYMETAGFEEHSLRY
jgi:hypothetical protein